MSRARQWGLPWPMLFLRTAFINVASLNVAWRSQVWQGPRAHNPWTEEMGLCSLSPCGIPAVDVHLTENVQKKKKKRNFEEKCAAVGCNLNLWNNSHLSFQRMFQTAEQLFTEKSQAVVFPQKKEKRKKKLSSVHVIKTATLKKRRYSKMQCQCISNGNCRKPVNG